MVSDTPSNPKDAGRTPVRLDEYAKLVITPRLARMLSHAEGVRKGEDIEPVHQMRVWSRRSRAALEVFRDIFPGKDYAELEREVKMVTDALGEARDLDVMVDGLSKRAEGLPEAQRGGIESFRDRLQTRRKGLQDDVDKALDRLETRKLADHFDTIADETSRLRELSKQLEYFNKSHLMHEVLKGKKKTGKDNG